MTPLETAIGILVYLVGSTIQGAIGFGANLFAVPILALVNPEYVPGPVLMINPVLTSVLTWRERGNVDGEALGWTILGRLPGIAIGVFALSLVSEERLGVLFGVLLLGAVAGVGGPPVAIVLSDLSGPAFRATMSPYFLVGTTLSLAALALGGHFDLDDLVAGLWLLPGVLVGAVVSGPLRRHVDAGRTAKAVYVRAAAAAVALLVRSLA